MTELTPIELAVLKNVCEEILSKLTHNRDDGYYCYNEPLIFDAATGKCFYQICNKLLTNKNSDHQLSDDECLLKSDADQDL
jgi:hypothetical protein